MVHDYSYIVLYYIYNIIHNIYLYIYTIYIYIFIKSLIRIKKYASLFLKSQTFIPFSDIYSV